MGAFLRENPGLDSKLQIEMVVKHASMEPKSPFGGAGVAQWWERLPLTNLARVQILDPVYKWVEFVVGSRSPLLRGFFSTGLSIVDRYVLPSLSKADLFIWFIY